MPSGQFIAYYRVSTARQGRSGLGLQAQRTAVHSHLKGNLLEEFTEIESGKRNDRPQLSAALAACRLHRAVLVIAKLDRLARNVAFVSALMESGVEFVACDFPQANRLTIHILAAVAEHEACMISQRTKAALSAAKARGVRLGGFRGGIATDEARTLSRAARAAQADRRAFDLAPIIRSMQVSGTSSLRGIATQLDQRGITAPRGGSWSAAQVRNVISRITNLENRG